MKKALRQRWEKVRGSYWFLPSLMTLSAIVLSGLLIELDETVGAAWIRDWSYLYDNKPDGARALLSTISGSMIGVAGVTFSITIAAVAYASTSFGPRIITNFMKDTGNQITLGTFISTYVYCLLVLRTVRSGDEGGFVPHLAVFFGVLLALASLGVLIFFIHHIPESIHVDHVLAGIGKEMMKKADSLYPDVLEEDTLRGLTEPDQVLAIALPADRRQLFLVEASCDGYVQSIDVDKLKSLAAKHSLALSLQVEPGDFVAKGGPLVQVANPSCDKSVTSKIAGCFLQDDSRSVSEDLFFLIDQMVDIAARALSPGTNDPFTAKACVEWLCALLSRLADRSFPAQHWEEKDASLVLSKGVSYTRYVEAVWDSLRPYVETDRNAALAMLDSGLATLHGLRHARRLALIKAMHGLVEGCLRNFAHSRDLAALELRRERLAQVGESKYLSAEP